MGDKERMLPNGKGYGCRGLNNKPNEVEVCGLMWIKLVLGYYWMYVCCHFSCILMILTIIIVFLIFLSQGSCPFY